MRKVALAALLAAAGCTSYSNPYDTSDDIARYEERERQSVEFKRVQPYDYPQRGSEAFSEPDLEGWRDGVLAAADAPALKLMHAQTQAEVARLEARRAELLKLDHHNNHDPLTVVESQLKTQKLRLQMIEDRGRGVLLRRDE